MDLLAEIADERRLTADFLAGLDDRQLSTPSLCGDWTVRDVGAHLLMPLVTPMPKVALAMMRSGMNFDRANVRMTADVAKLPTDEIVAGLREHAMGTFTPPGMGLEAPLADLVIHGQDMRRPLGLKRGIPADRQRLVLDYLTGVLGKRSIVPGTRCLGLSFRATDLDWSAGEGPEVAGPAEAIMMAVAGRPVAVANLDGDGVAELSGRLTD